MWRSRAGTLLRALLMAAVLALPQAGCNTSGEGIPHWQQAYRAIEWHYENNAWERNATCIPPQLRGITQTTILEDTPERLVLDVRYLWDVEGQNNGFVGVPCFGSGNRQFVLSKRSDGSGYSVVSMTGPQR